MQIIIINYILIPTLTIILGLILYNWFKFIYRIILQNIILKKINSSFNFKYDISITPSVISDKYTYNNDTLPVYEESPIDFIFNFKKITKNINYIFIKGHKTLFLSYEKGFFSLKLNIIYVPLVISDIENDIRKQKLINKIKKFA